MIRLDHAERINEKFTVTQGCIFAKTVLLDPEQNGFEPQSGSIRRGLRPRTPDAYLGNNEGMCRGVKAAGLRFRGERDGQVIPV